MRKSLSAVLGALMLVGATLSATGCTGPPPPCVQVSLLNDPPVQGVDRDSNAPILLYPVSIEFGNFGRAKGMVTPKNGWVPLPTDTSPIEMYLPEGRYTFTGSWVNGTCNPEVEIVKS